jgi:class 3 adenylate cyclase
VRDACMRTVRAVARGQREEATRSAKPRCRRTPSRAGASGIQTLTGCRALGRPERRPKQNGYSLSMGHAGNLATIKRYLMESYQRQTTLGVPKRSDLTFGNTLKTMQHAVVVYIDMRSSRQVMNDTTEFVSAKVHKAFLQSIVYCIETRGGHFRSFNGDGALAFFRGLNAASRAARGALDLKAYVHEMNKLLAPKRTSIDFGVGIGQGKVHVLKSGKRGDDQTKQDLVWIGLPVYVAVELSDFGKWPRNIWIRPRVRATIDKENHLNVVNHHGKSMWTRVTRNLPSVGRYEVRYTTFQSVLFS